MVIAIIISDSSPCKRILPVSCLHLTTSSVTLPLEASHIFLKKIYGKICWIYVVSVVSVVNRNRFDSNCLFHSPSSFLHFEQSKWVHSPQTDVPPGAYPTPLSHMPPHLLRPWHSWLYQNIICLSFKIITALSGMFFIKFFKSFAVIIIFHLSPV